MSTIYIIDYYISKKKLNITLFYVTSAPFVHFRYSNKDRGKRPFDKKKFNPWGLKIGTVLDLIQTRKGISMFVQAKFVIDTLSR